MSEEWRPAVGSGRLPVEQFGSRKKPREQIPECDVCGDHLEECQDGECSQYQLYVAGARSLPPGPRLPRRSRQPRQPLSKATLAGGELVYSNGKGVSIQADPDTNEIDAGWQDLPACDDNDDAELSATLPAKAGGVGGTG